MESNLIEILKDNFNVFINANDCITPFSILAIILSIFFILMGIFLWVIGRKFKTKIIERNCFHFVSLLILVCLIWGVLAFNSEMKKSSKERLFTMIITDVENQQQGSQSFSSRDLAFLLQLFERGEKIENGEVVYDPDIIFFALKNVSLPPITQTDMVNEEKRKNVQRVKALLEKTKKREQDYCEKR